MTHDDLTEEIEELQDEILALKNKIKELENNLSSQIKPLLFLDILEKNGVSKWRGYNKSKQELDTLRL